jgi:uncharacterized protein (TIGR02118 family)
MYKLPQDADAFQLVLSRYAYTIANKIPGLRKYEASPGPVATPAGPSALHLIAALRFDDLISIRRDSGSPEGQVAAANVGHSPPAAPT